MTKEQLQRGARSALRRTLGYLSASLVAGVVSTATLQADSMLFDFGADATPTEGGPGGDPAFWNNVTAEGSTDDGMVPNLLLTDGSFTVVSLQMVSRFNGPNESGTATNPEYPVSATRDSLYGNTENWQGLTDIMPVFKLVGLDPAQTYTLTFFASRVGVSDNRETRYTITGTTETTLDLDAANNVENTVTAGAVVPTDLGEITIGLTPGANNNNANHFTYLNVLEIEPSSGGKILIDFGAGGSITEYVEPPMGPSWNNITATIGTDAVGSVPGLVTTNGTFTGMGFAIVSPFNTHNGNGTTEATVYPTTATQDSLFGNTETFNGKANVFPEFKLTGLDPSFEYSFTFHASRTGVGDNREARYTVTGANSGTGDLNAANNVDNTVTVEKIQPTEAGEITVAVAAGPNNNNGNHFAYLGVMQVDFGPVRTPRMLIDFGSAVRQTSTDPLNTWNNVTTEVGTTDTGALDLVTTGNIDLPYRLQMVARFNGLNENGTEFSTLFPLDATRDSLYGNTELFNNASDIFPIFKLTGLDPATAYDLQFFASRMGVGDNRETRYTVTGVSEAVADLNAAVNENEVAAVADVLPNAAGEITIAITPGPNNSNGNHFTYLGVMQIDWEGELPDTSEPATLSGPEYGEGTFSFTINGTAGETYVVRRTRDFETWEDAQTVTLTGDSLEVEVAQTESHYFYQVVAQ